MNNDLYIYHHLGLGDHIICNGLVRSICSLNKNTFLFCKPHNVESVKFMYRDIYNLNIIPADDAYAIHYLRSKDMSQICCFGQYAPHWYFSNNSFDENFYYQANLDFKYRWDNFYVRRDFLREQGLYDQFHKTDYIFLHEDKDRGYEINKTDNQCIKMERGITDNIFDYLTVIDKAREVHIIDSCLMFILDSMPDIQKDKNLFIHRYSRLNDSFNIPKLKRKWNIIT